MKRITFHMDGRELSFDLRYKTASAVVDMSDYVSQCRDVARIEGYCRQCANFGKRWMCPPFTGNELAVTDRYSLVTLIVSTVCPCLSSGVPASPGVAAEMVARARKEVDARMMELEEGQKDALALLPGSCLLCGREDCTRRSGRPCRFPEQARFSLEAIGFDIARTLQLYFGIELKWCEQNRLPEYLTLVSAVFSNERLQLVE